jgi:hypothetical protein
VTYTFARERIGDSYSGPEWAPISLWLLAQDDSGTGSGHYARMLMIPAAKNVWRLMEDLGLDVDWISAELPVFLAEKKRQWDYTPKMSPSEFTESRAVLARRAEQLAIEVERSSLCYADDDEVDVSIFSLMTGLEINEMKDRVKEFVFFQSGSLRKIADEDKEWLSYTLFEFIQYLVPDVPKMLRLVGSGFLEEEPMLSKPNLPNAERNHFVKWLISFFDYEAASPALVAGIIGLLFSQGVSENEVSQQKARHFAVRSFKSKSTRI